MPPLPWREATFLVIYSLYNSTRPYVPGYDTEPMTLAAIRANGLAVPVEAILLLH